MADYHSRLDRLERALGLEHLTEEQLRKIVGNDDSDLSALSDAELRQIVDGTASDDVLSKVLPSTVMASRPRSLQHPAVAKITAD